MMFKKPSQRVKCPPVRNVGKPQPGTFIYDMMTPCETETFTFVKGPVYNQGDYLKLLENNHKKMGIPYVKPKLIESTPYVPPMESNEPRLEFPDQVYVTLRVLKNGIVRVKVNCAIMVMYEKYYHRGVQAPFKTVLQAYKSHGFSPQFLEKIKKSNEKKQIFAKKVPGILTKIFEREANKKAKKEKEKEKMKMKMKMKEEEEEEVPPLDDVEDDDIPPIEECELDVEPDEEDGVEEEEYVSDNET